MAEHTIGEALPTFGGGRNLVQTGKAAAALQDVLQAHDDRLAGEVNVTLSDDAPVAVGLSAAAEGVGTTASRDDHTHQISAALAALLVGSMTFTPDTEGTTAADTYRVIIQLKDALGTNIARRVVARLWLADSVASTLGTAVDTLAVFTGTLLKVVDAGKQIDVESDASGVITVDLTKTGAATRCVNVSAQGISSRSGALVFAA